MVKFLFKFLFEKLTYSQLVELVYTNPVVVAHFAHLQALREQASFSAKQEEDTPVVQEATVVNIFTRMDSEVYDYFERQVSNTAVSSNTSEIEAGFKLGVQHVLAKLRAGYVIPRSN